MENKNFADAACVTHVNAQMVNELLSDVLYLGCV